MIAEQQLSNADIVHQYCDDVLGGRLVAGELVRGSCNRYLKDLEREVTDDFPYHFCEDSANEVCDFFPQYLRHSTGSTAGQPFLLTPWQMFCIWNLFGWKREDETRRFRKAFISVARKNGKSTLAAGIAIYMARNDRNPTTGEPEARSEVILAATQREQADIVYQEVRQMLAASPTLKQGMTERKANPQQITFTKNSGYIRTVGSDRAKDGLNSHLVILDEVHAFTRSHRRTYDTLQTGSGFREQPLILTVTTAGDDRSYIWADEWRYARGVALNAIRDDAIFSMSFEIDEDDDPLDPANWIKANPNLGECLRLEYLEERAREAKESSLKLNAFTRYHANRAVASTASAFDKKAWQACAGDLSDWAEADAIGGGVDLGARDDFASFALCARFKDSTGDDGEPIFRYEVRSWAYIATDTVRDLKTDPFPVFLATGELRQETYPIDCLRSDLLTECARYGVDSVAYDPYSAQPFSELIEQKGVPIASMAQNCAHFNEPIQEFKALMADGRIRHDGGELLSWCLGNAVAVVDRQERWMLSKRDSAEKIDAIVATLMAFRRCSLAKPRAEGPLACF
jgi:phage terminase large subunit-like protein